MANPEGGDIGPDRGASALGDLLSRAGAASEAGDVGTLTDLITELKHVADAKGIDMPDLAERLAQLQIASGDGQTDYSLMDAAIWAGDRDRIRALGGVPDGNGSTADPGDAYAAIADGEPGAIDVLLSTDPDLAERSGVLQRTPLLAALDAPARNAADVERLIEAGADPSQLHPNGDDALSWAMRYKHQSTVTAASEHDLITLLVYCGADPDHEIGAGESTLHRAIRQAGVPQVAGLFAAGSDLSVPMPATFEPAFLAEITPLMLAAPKPEVFALLLEEGVDPRVADARGRMPLDFIAEETDRATEAATPDDPWSVDFADKLQTSLDLLLVRLAR